jgi:hypothetical protein
MFVHLLGRLSSLIRAARRCATPRRLNLLRAIEGLYTRNQTARTPYLCRPFLLALCTMPVCADVTREACLRAEQPNTNTQDVGGGPTQAPAKDLRDMLARLRSVMHVPQPVALVSASNGDIGVTSPPCPGFNPPTYVITLDTVVLSEKERQLKGATFAVLAHELGHVLQFSSDNQLINEVCSNNLRFSVKPLELMADFASGYAVYKTQRLAIDQGDTLFVRMIASLSDYAFTDVQHHGTVTERMNAFGFGQAAALRGRPLDMSALLRNSALFMQRLAGPNQTAISTGQSYEEWVQQALNDVYK